MRQRCIHPLTNVYYIRPDGRQDVILHNKRATVYALDGRQDDVLHNKRATVYALDGRHRPISQISRTVFYVPGVRHTLVLPNKRDNGNMLDERQDARQRNSRALLLCVQRSPYPSLAK